MDEFGEELRRRRRVAGLSLRLLAERVSFDYSYLAQVERGERFGSIKFAQQCDEALDADGYLADLFARLRGRPKPEKKTTVPPRRRAVLQAMTALATGAGIPTVSLEATRQGLASAVGNRPDSDEWESIAATYAREFFTVAPNQLLPELSADMLVLQRTMEAGDAKALNKLSRSVSQLGVVMAMTLAGLGQSRSAARWWQTARGAADQAGDIETRVLVRSWEVVNGLYEGRKLPDLLELADEALSITKKPCVGLASALAGKAQAMSLLKNREAATAALRELAALTERMPADAVANELSLFGWPEFRLRHTESYVLSHLGDTAKAYEAQDRAFDLYPPELARSQAMVQMHRARCLILDGHIAEGLGYGMRILVELPQQFHNAMLYEIAGHVLTAVPPNEQSRAAVADFRSLINRW